MSEEKQVIEELLKSETLTDIEIRTILKFAVSEDAIEQEKAIQSMKGKTNYMNKSMMKKATTSLLHWKTEK